VAAVLAGVAFGFVWEAQPTRPAPREKITANVIVFIELILERDYGPLN
jgi:hypothetical protein